MGEDLSKGKLITAPELMQAIEDDPNADSLSQLVRVAMQHYLSDTREAGSGLADAARDHLADLSETQQEIADQLDQIDTRLHDIHESVTSTNVSADIEHLADQIFDLLPSREDIELDPAIPDSRTDDADHPGTIEWVAAQVDASVFEVQTALDHLQEVTYAV